MSAQARPMISPAFLLAQRQLRFYTALIELTAERGFRGITVADVVKQAGVARNTFYETFRSKADLGTATMVYILQEVEDHAVAAATDFEGGAAVKAVIADLLAYVDEHRQKAWFVLVEGMNEMLSPQRDSAIYRLTAAFDRAISPLNDTVSALFVGGGMHIVHRAVLAGEPCVPLTEEVQNFLMGQFD